jgi:hypothetical protein
LTIGSAAACAHAQPYLDEWHRILIRSIDAVLTVIVNPPEQATALRQSSPFSGVLSPNEQMHIMSQWRRES